MSTSSVQRPWWFRSRSPKFDDDDDAETKTAAGNSRRELPNVKEGCAPPAPTSVMSAPPTQSPAPPSGPGRPGGSRRAPAGGAGAAAATTRRRSVGRSCNPQCVPLLSGVPCFVGMRLETRDRAAGRWKPSVFLGAAPSGWCRVKYEEESAPADDGFRAGADLRCHNRLPAATLRAIATAARERRAIAELSALCAACSARESMAVKALSRAPPPLPPTQRRSARELSPDTQTLLLWELFSGPYRSMTRAAGCFPDIASFAVDWEARFTADLHADLSRWSPWQYMQEHYSFLQGTHARLPHHVHLSPPCFAFGLAAAGAHGRGVGLTIAGSHSSIHALLADALLATWCMFIEQCWDARLPTTFCVENPVGSYLWKHPAMARLLQRNILVSIHVCYCRYGGSGKKPTVLAVSPPLASAGGPEATTADGQPPGSTPASPLWALRCHGNGDCAAVSASATEKGAQEPTVTTTHRGPAVYRLEECAIPPALCVLLHLSWRSHHGRLRLAWEKSHPGANVLSAASYAVIDSDSIRRLSFEWGMAKRLMMPTRELEACLHRHRRTHAPGAPDGRPPRPPPHPTAATGHRGPAASGAAPRKRSHRSGSSAAPTAKRRNATVSSASVTCDSSTASIPECTAQPRCPPRLTEGTATARVENPSCDECAARPKYVYYRGRWLCRSCGAAAAAR